jgi:D-beta-D-heptose 7-phosphate kinase/D-beta-D-heptose 1-phosphate adenosyltransferase
MKISIVSGGFDPLHIGHVELFEKAREISDALLVIVNTDEFLIEKKGKPFMLMNERMKIIESLEVVDLAIASKDEDQTVCKTLTILASIKDPDDELLFCNGGDRTNGENTPEHRVCKQLGIKSVYGLGGKIQSSSWLTEEKG